MIPQLVAELGGGTPAVERILASDPFDLELRMEQVWHEANVWALGGGSADGPAGKARRALFATGEFAPLPVSTSPHWHHWIYSFAIENTRAAQIFSRVVRQFRNGETLGVPSVAALRWLDVTESLLGEGRLDALQGSAGLRRDREAVRRNGYYRMFGMELAYGSETNAPYPFEKAEAANATFVRVFEELLVELWRAADSTRIGSSPSSPDDSRIFLLTEQLRSMLNARRGNGNLRREELEAATTLGWIELTLGSNTPLIVDLRAQASEAHERLRLLGERVGLTPHSRAKSLLAMAPDLSILLRAIEAGWVTHSLRAWLLYRTSAPAGEDLDLPVAPLGAPVSRIITEWEAATGRKLG